MEGMCNLSRSVQASIAPCSFEEFYDIITVRTGLITSL